MNNSRIRDSAITDSLGRYALEFSNILTANRGILSVKDIDLSENGSFMPKDTVVSIPEGTSVINVNVDRSTI
jgi:hypothetical protein